MQVQKETNKSEDFFNDDEPFFAQKITEKPQPIKIRMEIKAQTSMIKLNTKTILPAMCSIKSEGGQRIGVDLLCILDVSGSMQGQKIQLVKDTMKFLLQTLTPQDRLSIITFNDKAKRNLGLRPVNTQNIALFLQVIEKIKADGGTDINSGLQMALKSIKERKYENKVTSIFLLSDGQDSGADAKFQIKLAQQQNKNLPSFSIHSFGFGNDHDEQLMTRISDQRDGSFYYIKELATLDEAFCNALGGLITVVAKQIGIKISNVSKGLIKQIQIGKVYGYNWAKINQKEYSIKMLQMTSGVTKDYIFQLDIPAINSEVGDLDRSHDVIQGVILAKTVKGEQISGQFILKLTLLNENEQIPEVNQNIDVLENYLRVKASQAIEQNIKKADEGRYDEAQKGLGEAIDSIMNNKKARKERVESLVKDLEHCKQKCSYKEYQHVGRKGMRMAERAHYKQQNYSYANQVQKDMVQDLKFKKGGY